MDRSELIMDGLMLALTASAAALVCLPIAVLLLGWHPFVG